MSIQKITLIVGSPGSGKSTLGELMQKQEVKAFLIDDMSMIVKEKPCEFIEHQANMSGATHIIITDVNFCFSGVREKAIAQLEGVFNIKVDVIYFENNLAKCLKNIKERQDRGDVRLVEGLAKTISQQYQIPEGIEPIRIFQKNE